MDVALDKIIQGCIDNNRAAQEKLYRMFFPKMYAMCYRHTKDEDKTLMILNDGFLKVFKNIDSYNGSGSFEGWVRRLIYNCLSDFFRKENKYLNVMLFEEKEKKSEYKVLDSLYYEDLLKLVEKLPGNTHKVFNMYAIEGYNHREIAEILNISEGTSKWHLSEARKKLQSYLRNTNNSVNHAG